MRLLLGPKRGPEFTPSTSLPGQMRCALAALARGITKTRTARRGRRTMLTMGSATPRRARTQKSFLPIARRRQRDVLCDVILSARQFETWLTLDELAKLMH